MEFCRLGPLDVHVPIMLNFNILLVPLLGMLELHCRTNIASKS